MKDLIIAKRFKKIVEKSTCSAINRKSLNESQLEFDALDPTVKSLIDETIHIDGIAAQIAINLALIGFTDCSIDKRWTHYALYNDRIMVTITIIFDKPFVIDWESSIDEWYISRDNPSSFVPRGTAVTSLTIALYVPSKPFGIISSNDKILDYIFANANISAKLPNGESCVRNIILNYSEKIDDEMMSDLTEIKRILSKTMSAHIRGIKSFMLKLMDEFQANEEEKEEADNTYEVVDDEV